MAKWFRVCESFEEEAEADREYWMRFSPEARVALIDTMRAEWAEMSGEMKPTRDQADFLGFLEKHGVKALVIGAHAVAFHARPRYTKDIDIFVEASEENARRIIAAIEDFGFAELGLTVSDFSSPGRIVQLGHEPNRIDILTSIAGVTFEDAWPSRVEAIYAGQHVFFIGIEELIRAKEAVGRGRDHDDAELLRHFIKSRPPK